MFTVPNVIPAKGIEDFAGYWEAYCIVPPDSPIIYLQSEALDKKQLATAALLPKYHISETACGVKYYPLEIEIPVNAEFNAEDGTLTLSTDTGFNTVFFLNDNGLISHKYSNNDGVEATVYFKPCSEPF